MSIYTGFSISFIHRPVAWCGWDDVGGSFLLLKLLNAFHGLSPSIALTVSQGRACYYLWFAEEKNEGERREMTC